MKFSLLSLLLVLLLTSCKTAKHSSDELSDIDQEIPKTSKVIKVKANIGEIGKKSDPLTITAVEVRGNLLYIDVEYTGGCLEHSFEVNGSQNIQKSMPPIRAIELVHNSNNDECKAIEKRKLEIDITDLAYQKSSGSEIYFTLPGWNEKIHYIYF